ncbi:MotB family protein [Mangrovicella endophytica]|uniref:MotB family protein n=1 Tax=Mangrovicella endophytica TaxID=2066697 RepID=UPI001FDED528|nr:MotB family protein [Mangrovicella endophytica]
MSSPNDHRGEIIIVKRRGGEEEGHHGGVWKIAFADFMTAMMAFFLVMWLTNSSDDATKKQIAQYFNPIKLNDSTPSARGLNDGNAGAQLPIPQRDAGVKEAPGEPGGKPVAGDKKGGEDKAVFRDPYAVLAEIAAEGGPGTGKNQLDAGGPNGTGLPGLNGGEAYRDPFDPSSWQLSPNAVASDGKNTNPPPAEFPTTVTLAPPGQPNQAEADAAKAGADAAAKPGATAPADASKVASAAAADADAPKTEGEKIEQEIKALGQGVASQAEVTEGKGGITISLSDNVISGMFEVGSSRPTAATIAMMEKIAKILSERKGSLVIRGHTDARPYRGEEYDNWQLSTARAHMAYYMLVRGGLDQNRVSAIEGVADRDPRDAKDPNAAVNRRIEILLTEPKA